MPIFPFSGSALLWMETRLLRRQIAELQAKSGFLFSGNPRLPQVALTFDDGPDPDYTPQVLTVLQRYGVKATFFCIGMHAAAYPDLIQQEHLSGHLVGNHSWSHPRLALLSRSRIQLQLARTSDALQQAIGVQPIYFRPPYGAFRSAVLKQVDQLGMSMTLWTVDPKDWKEPGVDVIVSRVLGRVKNGDIILLHDGEGDRSQTVKALPVIIEGLQQRGFEFVTLQKMVDDLGVSHQ